MSINPALVPILQCNKCSAFYKLCSCQLPIHSAACTAPGSQLAVIPKPRLQASRVTIANVDHHTPRSSLLPITLRGSGEDATSGVVQLSGADPIGILLASSRKKLLDSKLALSTIRSRSASKASSEPSRKIDKSSVKESSARNELTVLICSGNSILSLKQFRRFFFFLLKMSYRSSFVIAQTPPHPPSTIGRASSIGLGIELRHFLILKQSLIAI